MNSMQKQITSVFF